MCSADRTPRNPRRPSTTTAAAPLPTHAADGAVIARPVSPKKKSGSGGGEEKSSANGGGGGGRGTAGAVVGEPLERCIGACMRMLHAMLRSEHSVTDNANASATAARSSSFVEAAGGGGSGGGGGGGGIDASERAKYVRMSFLEEDFGDAFGLDGSGWKDGVLREAGIDGAVQDAAAVAAGAGAGAPCATTSTGVDAAVVCLQECQSPDLQRGVLGVLLGLREDGPTKNVLRRELLR